MSQEWISVKDELPREMVDLVLVARNRGNVTSLPARYVDGEFIVVTGFDTVADRHVFMCATHWMHLPEPPK